jgi:hypothetical protein
MSATSQATAAGSTRCGVGAAVPLLVAVGVPEAVEVGVAGGEDYDADLGNWTLDR